METEVVIRAIEIAKEYEIIEPLMQGLHEHEKMLNDRTLPWDELCERYMQHAAEMQEENDGTCLVAFSDEMPVGFIFGYFSEDDGGDIEPNPGKELYISDGFVKEAQRGTGVYRKLNRRLEDIYREKGATRISRFTLTNNAKARRFMEKEGYAATRVLYEKWL